MQVELTTQEHEVLGLALAYAKAEAAFKAYNTPTGELDDKGRDLCDASTDAEIALVDAAAKLPVPVADSEVR